jgi:citrate lyase alpha subunit
MKQDEINAVKKAAEKMRKQQSAQDEIIEMARQAGLYQDINVSFHQALRNFYDLATAKEREACAMVCEQSFGVIGSTIAQAIRARGEA